MGSATPQLQGVDERPLSLPLLRSDAQWIGLGPPAWEGQFAFLSLDSMLISPGNALAASTQSDWARHPGQAALKLTHKMDPLIRADAHARASRFTKWASRACISAPGRPGRGSHPFSVLWSWPPGAHRPGCSGAGHAQLPGLSLGVPEPLLWQQVCPFPGARLLHMSSLHGWSMSLSWASRALYPFTRSFGSRSFTHSCRAGWESLLHFQSLQNQWALKEGGAPHMGGLCYRRPQRGGQGRGGD